MVFFERLTYLTFLLNQMKCLCYIELWSLMMSIEILDVFTVGAVMYETTDPVISYKGWMIVISHSFVQIKGVWLY